jgi:uncharacterized protein involved in exopolysaccharide biosynthesis
MSAATREDGIDLIALWWVAWRYKYVIASASIVCGLVAVGLALTAVPVYRAETVISEVRERDMSSGVVSQFAGLANLAGVNLGTNVGSEAKAVLKSHKLVEEFIRRNGLLQQILRGANGKPTLWLGVKRFTEHVLSINVDKVTGLITVSIDNSDSVTAARWADGFVALANELVRGRALDDAKRNVAYLNEQVARTNDVELRRIMYNLVENETKTLMLANARAEYAFTVIDPAVAPDIRISPRRTLMVLFGLVIGVCVGLVIAFAHNMAVRHRRAAAQPMAVLGYPC